MSQDVCWSKRDESLVSRWFIGLLLVWLASVVPAQGEPASTTAPLPDPAKGATAGAVVNANHSQAYRKLLPPELAELLDVGEFQFEAMLQPREPRRWKGSKAIGQERYEVLSSGELRGSLETGLRSSMFEVAQVPQGDQRQQAHKILWNATGAIAQYKLVTGRFKVAIFQRPDASPHWLEFLVERLYPLGLGQSPGTEKPLFREKITAVKPEAINTLSWLTLRFFGSGEDFVWAASPMINSIRQMTGSNRSDAMFSRLFAPDDLFVWSGKNELVEPLSISTESMLAPIIEAPEATTEKQGPCVTKIFSGASDVQLNSDSRRFSGAGGWVPSNTVMVRRNMWKIDLSSRDPFTNDVRQAVYVDIDSGLPVYKVVWDQAGRVSKVVGGLLRSVSDDSLGVHAVWAGQFILFPGDNARAVLAAQELSRCDATVKGKELADFDPSSFTRFDTRAKEAEGQKKKLEQPEKSDDILD